MARINGVRMNAARPGSAVGLPNRGGRPAIAPVPKNRNRGPARPPWEPAPPPADIQRATMEIAPGVIGLTGAEPEPFAAAPIPTDLPDWTLWNPNASTDVFPKITDPGEGSGSRG